MLKQKKETSYVEATITIRYSVSQIERISIEARHCEWQSPRRCMLKFFADFVLFLPAKSTSFQFSASTTQTAANYRKL